MTIKELLIKHEGYRKKPYKCTAGKNTIGIGYNFDDNPLPKPIKAYLDEHGELNDDCIDALFDISVKTATHDCKTLFPMFGTFSNKRQMALTDFLFQLGYARARKFVHAIAAINTGRWKDAASEMRNSTWAKQVPNRAAEITEMIKEG